MPGISQEAFSIVTQILEFWQTRYFNEGIQSESEIDGAKEAIAAQKLNNPDRIHTPIAGHETVDSTESQPESLKLDPPAADQQQQSVATAAVAGEPVPFAPASTEVTSDSGSPATPPDAPPLIDSAKETAPSQEQQQQLEQHDTKPKNSRKAVGGKLVFGKTVNPKCKADGSWNFHTVLRFIKSDSYTFETIFNRPSKLQPVPKATASVWFQLTKVFDIGLALNHIQDFDSGIWKVDYRFEHTHQTHSLKFDESVTHRGFGQTENDLLEQHASLLAPPLKRMVDTIESKVLSARAMDKILEKDRLNSQSPFLPTSSLAFS